MYASSWTIKMNSRCRPLCLSVTFCSEVICLFRFDVQSQREPKEEGAGQVKHQWPAAVSTCWPICQCSSQVLRLHWYDSTAVVCQSLICAHLPSLFVPFIPPLGSPQLQKQAHLAVQRHHHPLPLPKAAPCPQNFVTFSIRIVSSESSVNSVPWWQKTTATMSRHRLLKSFSGKAPVEVGRIYFYSLYYYLLS